MATFTILLLGGLKEPYRTSNRIYNIAMKLDSFVVLHQLDSLTLIKCHV